MERSDSRRERSVEARHQADSPRDDRWNAVYDDSDENGKDKFREASKGRSRERSKSSRREDKDHKSRDLELSKVSEREKDSKDYLKDAGRDRRKEDRDDYDKERTKEKIREKYDRDKHRDRERERDKDRSDRGKEKDHGKDRERDREREREREREIEKDSSRGRDKEKGNEKRRDRDREREKETDKVKDKDREKEKMRNKEKEREGHRDKEKEKERTGDKEKDISVDKELYREREKGSGKRKDEGRDKNKDLRQDDNLSLDYEDGHYRDRTKQLVGSHLGKDNARTSTHDPTEEVEPNSSQLSSLEVQDRIGKMKEERLRRKSDDTSDVLSWVTKSRKLEEKRNAKVKAFHLSKVFEEQDNINEEDDDDDEAAPLHTAHDLAGVKVLHGLDKVIEGGAVVLTLKDQSILANGDINEDVDMLENVEIGEQKQRDEAYKAAKKKTGIYDRYCEEFESEKKILPQYDDPVTDEGVTLDASGRFGGEAEKKLEELRNRLNGTSASAHFEDLSSSVKISSDYYTSEEMLQFQKPKKKKKSLRKKDKLDIDALEAEAISAGLGTEDLGSRAEGKRLALKEEQEKSEAKQRSNAFQSAYEKANEASKALRIDKTANAPIEVDDPVLGEDDADLYKSLQRARKVALKQQEGVPSGAEAIAQLASILKNSNEDTEKLSETEKGVVFTEMDEFVWGLQLDEEAHKPDAEDVFMDEDAAPITFDQEQGGKNGVWAEVKDTGKDDTDADQDMKEVVPDETIHETAVGKGLSGALQLLKERGTLKETVEWGGRNMDKKKSKLVGIYENDGQKEIRIERTDEYGRILTPKEAFRLLSHKFHGKEPGKSKKEKRMREYQDDLKIKQMKNSDTPSLSVERMREAQTKLKTPYLVLSGHVKPGQTSDPRSGFATVEKDFPGSLTPMLGDRKVEHFLGIKRNKDSGDMPPPPPKKPKK